MFWTKNNMNTILRATTMMTTTTTTAAAASTGSGSYNNEYQTARFRNGSSHSEEEPRKVERQQSKQAGGAVKKQYHKQKKNRSHLKKEILVEQEQPRRVERQISKEEEDWMRILELQEGSRRRSSSKGDSVHMMPNTVTEKSHVQERRRRFMQDGGGGKGEDFFASAPALMVVATQSSSVTNFNANLSERRWDESVSCDTTAMNSSTAGTANGMMSTTSSSAFFLGSSSNRSLRVHELDGSNGSKKGDPLPRHLEEDDEDDDDAAGGGCEPSSPARRTAWRNNKRTDPKKDSDETPRAGQHFVKPTTTRAAGSPPEDDLRSYYTTQTGRKGGYGRHRGGNRRRRGSGPLFEAGGRPRCEDNMPRQPHHHHDQVRQPPTKSLVAGGNNDAKAGSGNATSKKWNQPSFPTKAVADDRTCVSEAIPRRRRGSVNALVANPMPQHVSTRTAMMKEMPSRRPRRTSSGMPSQIDVPGVPAVVDHQQQEQEELPATHDPEGQLIPAAMPGYRQHVDDHDEYDAPPARHYRGGVEDRAHYDNYDRPRYMPGSRRHHPQDHEMPMRRRQQQEEYDMEDYNLSIPRARYCRDDPHHFVDDYEYYHPRDNRRLHPADRRPRQEHYDEYYHGDYSDEYYGRYNDSRGLPGRHDYRDYHHEHRGYYHNAGGSSSSGRRPTRRAYYHEPEGGGHPLVTVTMSWTESAYGANQLLDRLSHRDLTSRRGSMDRSYARPHPRYQDDEDEYYRMRRGPTTTTTSDPYVNARGPPARTTTMTTHDTAHLMLPPSEDPNSKIDAGKEDFLQEQDGETAVTAASTDVGPDDAVMIEIGAGQRARLRRTKETLRAVANNFITPAVCLGCSCDFFCISDCKYVFCPTCYSISPLEECETNTPAMLWDGKRKDIVQRRSGVGLGFTHETLFQMQAELAEEKKKLKEEEQGRMTK